MLGRIRYASTKMGHIAAWNVGVLLNTVDWTKPAQEAVSEEAKQI
jgi:hypothetical protein